MRLALLFLFLGSYTFAQLESTLLRDQFPTFEETAAFLNGKIASPIDSHTFDLSKRPDGVYLNVSRFKDKSWKIVDALKIWDLNEKVFKLPMLDAYLNKGANKPDFDWTELKYKSVDYDFYLFTGYPDWTIASKQSILKRQNHSAYELEVLARIYSSEAMACIQPYQSGNLVGFAQDYEPASYNSIEAKRVNEFVNAADSCLYFYKAILQAYPDYKLHLISDVHTKLGNEYLFFWHMLQSVREEEKAQQYLDACTYPKSTLDYGRSLLNSCKESAILFTSGDSDTYTLWYLQEKLGFRKDVVVINTSLLLTDWYLKMLRERSDLQFGLSLQEYAELQNHAFFVFEDQNETVVDFELSLDAVREFIENAKTTATPYPIIPASFSIERDGFDMEPQQRSSYLNLSEFTQLDIIHSNPERAIFCSSLYTLYNLGFWEFAVPWSISSELTRSPQKGSEEYHELHAQRMLDFLKSFNTDDRSHWTNLNYSQLGAILYDLAQFDEAYESKQSSVWNQLNQQINTEWVLSTKDEYLTPYYFNLLELYNTEDFEQLYGVLFNQLEDYLDTLSWKQLSSKNGIAQLEYYIRLFDRPTDRRAKFMLIKKLETLLVVPEVQQYLWTTIAVERLLNRIHVE